MYRICGRWFFATSTSPLQDNEFSYAHWSYFWLSCAVALKMDEASPLEGTIREPHPHSNNSKPALQVFKLPQHTQHRQLFDLLIYQVRSSFFILQHHHLLHIRRALPLEPLLTESSSSEVSANVNSYHGVCPSQDYCAPHIHLLPEAAPRAQGLSHWIHGSSWHP